MKSSKSDAAEQNEMQDTVSNLVQRQIYYNKEDVETQHFELGIYQSQ